MVKDPHERVEYTDVSDPSGHLRVHAIEPSTKTHGPGKRYSIWTQGCHKRCPGCDMQAALPINSEIAKLRSPEEIIAQIKADIGTVWEVKGITLQGGEPLIQAENLAKLLVAIHAELPHLSILLFTGYTYEKIMQLAQTHTAVRTVLDHCHWMISEPFYHQKRDNGHVWGSTNQRVTELNAHPSVNFSEPEAVEAAFARHGREYIIQPLQGTKVSTGNIKK